MLLQSSSTVSAYIHFVILSITDERIGLDNLPNEVSHLLQEIRHREIRTQGMYAFYIENYLQLSGYTQNYS